MNTVNTVKTTVVENEIRLFAPPCWSFMTELEVLILIPSYCKLLVEIGNSWERKDWMSLRVMLNPAYEIIQELSHKVSYALRGGFKKTIRLGYNCPRKPN